MHLSTVRVGLVTLALATAPARGAAQGRGFAYTPGSYHYRLTTVLQRSQDQAAGRAPFAFEVTTKQQITVNLAAMSRDTLRLSITVDSIGVASSLAAPPPNLDRIRGVTLTGRVSPSGRLYAFQPPAGADAETAALYAAFRKFLISFPARPLAAGSRWADTVTDVVNKEGLDITTITVTTSKVTGDTTVAGQRAWRVERSAVVTATGNGKEAGRPLHLRNDGTISGTHLFSTRGVYLGSSSTQRSEMTLSAGESETSAPIVQTISSNSELMTRKP